MEDVVQHWQYATINQSFFATKQSACQLSSDAENHWNAQVNERHQACAAQPNVTRH